MSFVLVVLATMAMSHPAAADECWADWSEAAPIVKNEGLVSVEQLMPDAKTRLKGDVVKVTLCNEAGKHVYRLVVRDGRGNLKTVTVDAKNPF